MRWRSVALLLVAAVAGCARGRSYLVVTARGHAPLAATSLHLTILNAGQSATVDVVPNADPFVFSLSFDPERSGAVDLTADARAASMTVASRSSHVLLAPGGVVEATFDFAAAAVDGGGTDQPAPPDLAGADLAGADLATPPDLAPPPDLTSSPDLLPGPRCRALANNGSPMSGGATAQTALLDVQFSFTIEAWVYVNQNAGAMGAGIAVHGGMPAAAGWELGLAPNSTRLELRLWANQMYVVQGPNLVTQKWVHVAAEYDGGSIKVYASGIAFGPTPIQGVIKYPNAPTAPFLFGDRLDGFVDEVRVSNTARYVANFVPAPNFTGDQFTVVLYHLDENGGNTTADASNNKLVANIVGQGALSGAPCF